MCKFLKKKHGKISIKREINNTKINLCKPPKSYLIENLNLTTNKNIQVKTILLNTSEIDKFTLINKYKTFLMPMYITVFQ